MFWLLLGGLVVGVQLFIRKKLQEAGKAKIWPNCILVLLANLAIAFGLAWAYSSIIEYEVRAAMMGLIMFGGTGIVIATVAYKVITKPEKVEKKEEKKVEEVTE